MTFIHTIREENAEGMLEELYQAAKKTNGYVPNFVKTFSLRPEIYQAWTKLIGAIRASMRLRRYELVTFSAAMAQKCTY